VTFKQRLLKWWLGTAPVFAICLDCDGPRRLVSYHFATLLSGRVTGRWFTGAGTCIPCYTNGEWKNTHHKFPNRKKANNG